jgi:hypothetical protein
VDCVRCCASGIGEKRLLRAAGERGRERGQDTRVRHARRLDGCCPPDWGKWFKDPCLAKERLSPRFRDVSRQDENAEGECIEKAYERPQKAHCLIPLRSDLRSDDLPGEEILVANGRRFRVVAVVAFEEEDESPFVRLWRVEGCVAAGVTPDSTHEDGRASPI